MGCGVGNWIRGDGSGCADSGGGRRLEKEKEMKWIFVTLLSLIGLGILIYLVTVAVELHQLNKQIKADRRNVERFRLK